MVAHERRAPGTAARIVLIACALTLAWLTVRTAVQSAVREAAPQAAAALWPPDGPSQAALARSRIAATDGHIDAGTRALYIGALEREPTLAEPLFFAGLKAATDGDQARAERLMLAARTRDPRSSAVRLWLFDHFVRSGQFDRALAEVGPISQLRGDARPALMAVVVALADTDQGRAALMRKLAQRPFWRPSFFRAAARGAEPLELLAMLNRLPPLVDQAARDDERRSVLVGAIDAGQGAAAYHAWRQSLPPSYRARARGIYDPNFAGWPGAQPFTWTIPAASSGLARMVTAGDLPQQHALEVQYSGAQPAILAEQLLAVAPGTYQLQAFARQRAGGVNGARLALRATCGRNRDLGGAALTPLTTELRRYSGPVTIPASCDVIRVRVTGAPGEMFGEVVAQVTGVSITSR